jgi:predicted alpha/beta-fold hydrolase
MEIVKAAWEKGFQPVVANYRGQAGVPLKTARIYHGGDTQDLSEAFSYIHQKYCKERKLFTLGISLSAVILANYLCEARETTPVTASCSIACHFNTTKAIEHMSMNLFGAYDYALGIFCSMASAQLLK